MRATIFLSAGALLLLAAAAALWGEDPAERERAERVAQLVQQLGAPEFAHREAAMKALDELGEAAIPQLRQAAADDDFEIRWRARLLVSAPTRKSRSIGLELVLVQAGEFPMGSPAAEVNRQADERQHAVRIGNSFYLGRYEVTQEEYRLVMKTSPSWFAASGGGSARVAGMETT